MMNPEGTRCFDIVASVHIMGGMRTTLDIDPFVLSTAKEVAMHSRESLGTIISAWARRGIETSSSSYKSLERNGFLLFDTPPDAVPLTSETVRELLTREGLPA